MALRPLVYGLRVSVHMLCTLIDFIAGRRRPNVPDAILADATITKRQRRMLIDVYESFRRQTASGAAPDGHTARRPDNCGSSPSPAS
ncbi:hypothetical protein GCM10022224_094540 [Nonomuraea antimicrobica]|uniref:Transposase n=1 Tax=Nonomuraea antimicrobica TaxID=561173 RepID=A0ABP7E6Z1_9ACTN